MATSLVLFLTLVFNISFLGVGQRSSSGRMADQSQSSLEWFLATSKTTLGSKAWLIGVAADGSAGRFYSEAGMVALIDVSRARDGKLQFGSERVLDHRYRFDGTVSGE